MKLVKVTCLMLSLCCSVAIASIPVTVDMTFTWKGRTSHPRIRTHAGQSATIEVREEDGLGYAIEITPHMGEVAKSPNEKREILRLEISISEILGNELRILTRPQIAVFSGETGTIKAGGNGVDAYELSVTPTLK